jgi:hypothetical protein
MKIKYLVPFLLCFSLFGCNDTNVVDEPTIEDGDDSDVEVSDSEKIDNFVDLLSSVAAEPNSLSVSAFKSYSFLTDADPIVVEGNEEYVSTRYHFEGEEISISDGVQTVGDSSDNFRVEIFYDDAYFYKLVSYESSPNDNYKQLIAFDEKDIEDVLSLSLVRALSGNILEAKNYLSTSDFVSSFPTKLTSDTSFSFSITVKDEDQNPTYKVSYDVDLTIENDLITACDETIKNFAYAGGEVVNSSEINERFTCNYGQIEEYQGTLSDPDDYQLLEN